MSKNDLTSVRAPKVKTSVIATKRTKARLAKLKTSSWCQKTREVKDLALALPCHELRNTRMSQGRRSAAKLLTKDEARRIAVNIVELPGLVDPLTKNGASICAGP